MARKNHKPQHHGMWTPEKDRMVGGIGLAILGTVLVATVWVTLHYSLIGRSYAAVKYVGNGVTNVFSSGGEENKPVAKEAPTTSPFGEAVHYIYGEDKSSPAAKDDGKDYDKLSDKAKGYVSFVNMLGCQMMLFWVMLFIGFLVGAVISDHKVGFITALWLWFFFGGIVFVLWLLFG